jgi:hypothetical protein
VCFALAVGSSSLRASALRSLVHHKCATGDASVAVVFRADRGGAWLVVERCIVGGRRSEWRLQECSCGKAEGGGAARGEPWVCTACKVRTVRREALREALLAALGLDIDVPERFVVHQSNALAVAHKGPVGLLALLEGAAGTASLGVAAVEAATAAREHRTTAAAAEAELATEERTLTRHAGAMTAFEALQESGARLRQMQREHLQREATFHGAAVREGAGRLVELRAASEAAGAERDAAAARRMEADSAARTADEASVKAAAARNTAERQHTMRKEEGRALGLALKKATADEKRAAKSLTALRDQRTAADEDERAAQLSEATALAAYREAEKAARLLTSASARLVV